MSVEEAKVNSADVSGAVHPEVIHAQPVHQFNLQQPMYYHPHSGMMPLTSNHHYLPRIQPTAFPYSYNRFNAPMYMNPNYTLAPPQTNIETEVEANPDDAEKKQIPQIPQPVVQPMATTASYANPVSYSVPAYRQTIFNHHPSAYMPAPVQASHIFNHMPASQIYPTMQAPVHSYPFAPTDQIPQVNVSNEPVDASQEPENNAQELQAEIRVQPQGFINQAPISHIPAYQSIARPYAAAPMTTRTTLLPQSYSYQPTAYVYPGTGYQAIPHPYAAPVVPQIDSAVDQNQMDTAQITDNSNLVQQ